MCLTLHKQKTVEHCSVVTIISAITIMFHRVSSVADTWQPVINLLTSEVIYRVALGFIERNHAFLKV